MSKEHAYAYEAGYRDGSIHYELEHCPACKNIADLQEALAENANLRDSLKALMMGTYAELCTDRDQQQCRECSMRHGDDTCVTADAMELLGIDMYGEPLKEESRELGVEV